MGWGVDADSLPSASLSVMVRGLKLRRGDKRNISVEAESFEAEALSDGEIDEETKKKTDETDELVETDAKARVPVFERDAELEAELALQFGTSDLTRKQREERDRQVQERQEQKDRAMGLSDDSKADLARLAEVRAKREEASKKREEQERLAAEKAVDEKEKKESAHALQLAVGLMVVDIVKTAPGGQMSLNALNQNPECKKKLKPLCKKASVKQLNKAFLEKFIDMLTLTDQGQGNVLITAKTD